MYRRVDGMNVPLQMRAYMQKENDSEGTHNLAYVNGVRYTTFVGSKFVELFVSGTELNRVVPQIKEGARNVKTIIFPSTVR